MSVADWSDEDLVKALCEIESGLTEWEMARADDWWYRVMKEDTPLTHKQRRIAIQIVEEKGGQEA